MRKTFIKLFVSSFVFPAILLNWLYCQDQNTHNGIRIAWDYNSMQQLADKGGYPRLTRLEDSSLLVIYETRTGNIHLKRSIDNGVTWSCPTEVFSKFVYVTLDGRSTIVNMANPEIKQLQNGDIVIACNYRPEKAEIAPYSIALRRSTDNAKTWFSPQNLYTAAPRFEDGCWEPSFLQLPNGELQVYYANENPYSDSNEQEISMVSSPDNGITWTEETKTVSFRKNRRDGMPVAQIIDQQIVLIIEDNHINQFKPYTIRCDIDDNWANTVLSDSPDRNYALLEKISDTVYMGAPYMIRLPHGETMISYQTNENRASDWERSTMEVAVGDSAAQNFHKRSQPFPVPLNKEAKWNSLALWDSKTIVALTSSNFNSSEIAPWLIKGHIIPPICLTDQDNKLPIFIGSKGKTSLRAGIHADNDNLYINCVLTSDQNNNSTSNGNEVLLFLCLNGQALKIQCSETGSIALWRKEDDLWKSDNLLQKIVVRSQQASSKNAKQLHITVPKKIMTNKALTSLQMGLALSVKDTLFGAYTEYLANMTEKDTDTWLNIKL